MTTQCPKCKAENPDESKFCNECGLQIDSIDQMPAPPTQTLEVPKEELTTDSTFAGRYQIIEELGRGGMGRVYKATDTKINEKVALKLIKPEIASEKRILERFGNELRIARKIVHKNVGRMYDINEEKGTHYITMEYVSGQDLKGFIRQSGQMAIGTSVSVAKQICEGLSEAHRTGVIHRDLKPSNIMIDQEGNVRIMDFGIARSLKEKGITGAGVMIGTPEYMSPEQAEAKAVDKRSDIYSLGVILYEMVTGRVPFDGDTALSIAMRHKGETPKDPKEYNAQIPDDLSHLILKCLEKDKDSRFQSAGEIQSDLENIEKSIPTTDRAIPTKKSLTSKEITVQFSLKKLFVPGLVFIAVIVIGSILWKVLLQKEAAPPSMEKSSIAVLPFIDLSPNKDQEYFCDGMTDELIAKLSKLEGLKVIPRTSMMRYKNTEKDITEIGQELEVKSIMEGSVRKEKENIRVIATLINVSDNSQLWSETYDQRLESIFVIQSSIAEKISNALLAKLSPDEKEKLQKNPTESLEAYNLYLQGRFFWNKRTEEGFNRAIEYFEEAIKKDQRYALAYSGLADCYNMLGDYSYLPPKEAYPKAKEAAQKALLIDNTLAQAHTSLAFVLIHYESDLDGAKKKYELAIQLNLNYGTAHQWYANCLSVLGRHDEAIAEAKKARELDPLSPIINRNVGNRLYYARQFDQAIEESLKALKMFPDFFPIHRTLGYLYLKKGMFSEAIAAFQKVGNAAILGYAYALSGNQAKAQVVLNDLKEKAKNTYVPSNAIAQIYIGLGDKDHAIEWLEKAYEERASGVLLKFDPVYDPLRTDPRFKALLKKMGLD